MVNDFSHCDNDNFINFFRELPTNEWEMEEVRFQLKTSSQPISFSPERRICFSCEKLQPIYCGNILRGQIHFRRKITFFLNEAHAKRTQYARNPYNRSKLVWQHERAEIFGRKPCFASTNSPFFSLKRK